MVTARVKLLNVREVDGGELPPHFRYGNNGRYTTTSYETRRLLLKFHFEGRLRYVYTPQVVIAVTEGFLYHKRIAQGNNWFKLIEGKVEGHKGSDMFDGGGLNIAISSDDKVVPTVESGEEVLIGYCTHLGKMSHLKNLTI